MALSTLNPPLPALEELITLTPRPAKKKIGPRLTRDIRRNILLLRELNDYEDEPEYTYERIPLHAGIGAHLVAPVAWHGK